MSKILKTLKISISPKQNHCFLGFCKNHVFAIWMRFDFKNQAKSISKMKPKP